MLLNGGSLDGARLLSPKTIELMTRSHTSELTPPLHVYNHDDGCSVTGGYVYRGKAVRSAVGRYFFGDYCSNRVWSLKVVDGKATDVVRESFDVPAISSFGEDAGGELYLLSLNGPVYKLSS